MGEQKTKKEKRVPRKPEEIEQRRRLLNYITPVRNAARKAREAAIKAEKAARETARKALKEPGKTVLAIQKISLGLKLAPLAIVSGCGPLDEPHRPPSPNQEIPKIPIKEAKYWWPAYVVISGQLKDVSLGFTEETKPYDASKMYSSPDSIPQDMRKKGRDAIGKALDFSKYFLRDDVYKNLVKDNVFWPVRGTEVLPGAAAMIVWAAHGFRIVGPEGSEIAACYEGCQEYKQTVYFPLERGGAVLHELLHDSWSLLSDQDKKRFTKLAIEFFNAYARNWQQDELLSKIWGGEYPDPNNPDQTISLGFKQWLTGPELDNWTNERLGTLDENTKNNIKQAIREYVNIFSNIVDLRTHGTTEKERAGFLVGEGYPLMGANYGIMNQIYYGESPAATETKSIPVFMSSIYKKILKDGLVDQLTTDGSGYFTDLKKFYEFKSYLRDFVDYMIARYPELQP
jgi:hypothetical protein